PKNYKPEQPIPVVVALHGLGGNMEGFSRVTGIEDLAEKENFITIIPNGLPSNLRGWNAGFFRMAGTNDDSKTLLDILDKVQAEFKTDAKRIHMFGHSNGAMMTYYMGGIASERFASIAGIAGTVGIPTATGDIKAVPTPKSPMSVLMIHSKGDRMVAFEKGAQALLQCTGAIEGADWWATQFGCKAEPETDAPTYTTQLRKGGKQGVEVKLIAVKEGTHDIPGAFLSSGRESKTGLLAIEEVWNFFKTHPKPSDLN
ncbi:MAG TPA: PHB depolymerase family esterase, partial [Fimbriimonas sp.]|nr:PHB depolymerase family esterase [Fimbriimonas sp.]